MTPILIRNANNYYCQNIYSSNFFYLFVNQRHSRIILSHALAIGVHMKQFT